MVLPLDLHRVCLGSQSTKVRGARASLKTRSKPIIVKFEFLGVFSCTLSVDIKAEKYFSNKIYFKLLWKIKLQLYYDLINCKHFFPTLRQNWYFTSLTSTAKKLFNLLTQDKTTLKSYFKGKQIVMYTWSPWSICWVLLFHLLSSWSWSPPVPSSSCKQPQFMHLQNNLHPLNCEMKELFLDNTAAFSFIKTEGLDDLNYKIHLGEVGSGMEEETHKLMYPSNTACHYEYTSKHYAAY